MQAAGNIILAGPDGSFGPVVARSPNAGTIWASVADDGYLGIVSRQRVTASKLDDRRF